ncbi:hypothetical protein OSTOST_19844, partial [Ostertagia ostertagi]
MFRELTKRDPRLTTGEGLRRLFDEIDEGNVKTQEELLERLFHTAELEEHIDNAGGITPEDEDVFVEHMRNTVASGDMDDLSGTKAERRAPRSNLSKLDSFVEYLLQKINQQWLSLIYAEAIPSSANSCVHMPGTVCELAIVVPAAASGHRLCFVLLDGLFYIEDVSQQKESYFITDNNWEPYINFALSVSLFILSVGAANRRLPYCSLACGISSFFALVTLPVILSRMHFAAGNWRIWRPLVQFRVGYLVASLGIPSLWLCTILVYILMASKRKTWTDVLHAVVPH